MELRGAADSDGDGRLSPDEASSLARRLISEAGGAGTALAVTTEEGVSLQIQRGEPQSADILGDLGPRPFHLTAIYEVPLPKPIKHSAFLIEYRGWPGSPGNCHWWVELGEGIGLCHSDEDLEPQGEEQRHWLAQRRPSEARVLKIEGFYQADLRAAGELSPEELLRINSEPEQIQNLLSLLDEEGSGLAVLAMATLFAFIFGAGHALSPGHGKTLVAAYLVGSRGTVRHAVFLGLVVTLSHVSGVYLVALISFAVRRLAEIPAHEFQGHANASLSVVSALIIIVIGLVLLWRRWRGLSTGHHHDHDHDHGNDHGHHHHHHHGEVKRGDLLSLGISGGIVPCPTAMVIVLYAFSSDRLGLGLWLVTIFSLGLAVVLVSIGVILVKARSLIASKESPRRDRFLRALTVLSPMLIIILGSIALVLSLREAGALF